MTTYTAHMQMIASGDTYEIRGETAEGLTHVLTGALSTGHAICTAITEDKPA